MSIEEYNALQKLKDNLAYYKVEMRCAQIMAERHQEKADALKAENKRLRAALDRLREQLFTEWAGGPPSSTPEETEP